MVASLKRKTSPTSTRAEGKRQRIAQQKRSVRDTRPKSTTKLSKVDPEPNAAVYKKSGIPLLPHEPPAFPRGGGSVLTPIERKQIQAKADRDVLFELQDQDGNHLASANGLSDDEDADPQGVPPPKRKTEKRTKKKIEGRSEASNLRIEGLTYKRIAVGSIILGQIQVVSARDIAIALPNNLTGYAPLTAVSAQFTEQLEKVLGHIDDAASEASSTENADINLKGYFHKGQFLRTYVTSTIAKSTDGGRAAKKRLDLSLEPSLCNTGITTVDMIVNNTVQASVISVEDHGLVMDLGIGDGQARGFLPLKELDEEWHFNDLKPGMVFLCMITGKASNGRTFKLSAKSQKLGSSESSHYLSSAPTVNALLPGTAVEILVSDVAENGLAGQVMGMLDVTADLVHSGMCTSNTEPSNHLSGTKIKGRLIYTFPLSDNMKLGFSLLQNVIQMGQSKDVNAAKSDTNQPQISAIIPDFKITRVEPGLGLFASVGKGNSTAFIHISRLDDAKVDSISQTIGPYKIGSIHRGRITGYNSMDELFLASFQKSVIEQPFLQIEDVKVGQQVKGTVEKLVYRNGEVSGVLVSLAEGITGLVPRMHLSDVQLLHPEKKFTEGTRVKARVMSKNIERRQIRLTLKKALVNSETNIWKDFHDIAPGRSSLGTLAKVESHGAVVRFFGDVRGYLPVSEMSEAYIRDATQHFQEGQVITVSALAVELDSRRLTLTCKDPESLDEGQRKALLTLQPGTFVTGKVYEKNEDDVLLRLDDNNVTGRLEKGFISDGSLSKRQSAMHKIRAGQTLRDLLIIEVLPRLKLVRLCNRSSLIQAAVDSQFPSSFQGLREGMSVKGFVTNITEAGVFVGFGAGLTSLLPRNQMAPEISGLPQYGMSLLQTISARVHSISNLTKPIRFWLTTKPQTQITSKPSTAAAHDRTPLQDPVDGRSAFLDEFVIGYKTAARIVSIKATQINVELAKDVQGRIDVSEAFDNWANIKDKKKPLKSFQPKQILLVRVLGIHDARNHRFLPISHRSGKSPVFELSAKPSFVNSEDLDVLSLDKVKPKSSWVAFVNNVSQDFLWVNITPNVRGRIKVIDASDDVSQLANVGTSFPIGSAVRVHVLRADTERNQLDLSAKAEDSVTPSSYKDVSKGVVLVGRVTKSSDRQLLVQLSEDLVGAVDLVDIADDFTKADPTKFRKNDVVRVSVIDVDPANKKISLSVRPSRVLSSSLPVADPEIASIDHIQPNKVYRGFITNIVDNGLFVALSHGVTAFVRVSDLSDTYLKDWKEHFTRDQLVRGRVVNLDQASNRVQMSLKDSVLNPDYKAPMTFDDLKVGQVVTGQVVKVEDFGVFILVDDSSNVRGLCHRSEVAESRIEDVRPLYNEGDVVKAKVLKLDGKNRRINFGLKASYFKDEDAPSEHDRDEIVDQLSPDGTNEHLSMGQVGSGSPAEESSDEDIGGTLVNIQPHAKEENFKASESGQAPQNGETNYEGLRAGGFDWIGTTIPSLQRGVLRPDIAKNHLSKMQKQKQKPESEQQLDETGNLDADGPQSADDYERLLLGEPDSSILWLQYMAFQLEVGEIDSARQIGERALKSINVGRDDEKLNVWVGLLNLENTYGDDESVQDTFKRACEYNDPQEIHNRLTSILIQSGKHEVSQPSP